MRVDMSSLSFRSCGDRCYCSDCMIGRWWLKHFSTLPLSDSPEQHCNPKPLGQFVSRKGDGHETVFFIHKRNVSIFGLTWFSIVYLKNTRVRVYSEIMKGKGDKGHGLFLISVGVTISAQWKTKLCCKYLSFLFPSLSCKIKPLLIKPTWILPAAHFLCCLGGKDLWNLKFKKDGREKRLHCVLIRHE